MTIYTVYAVLSSGEHMSFFDGLTPAFGTAEEAEAWARRNALGWPWAIARGATAWDGASGRGYRCLPLAATNCRAARS
jgi:hypothetical protein